MQEQRLFEPPSPRPPLPKTRATRCPVLRGFAVRAAAAAAAAAKGSSQGLKAPPCWSTVPQLATRENSARGRKSGNFMPRAAWKNGNERGKKGV